MRFPNGFGFHSAEVWKTNEKKTFLIYKERSQFSCVTKSITQKKKKNFLNNLIVISEKKKERERVRIQSSFPLTLLKVV